MKPIRIGFVMDPIASINPKKDSTLALMQEAQKRGWEVSYLVLGDLFISNGIAEGRIHQVEVFNNLEIWYKDLKTTFEPLHQLDVLVMRKDPPFDIEFIMATYILEKAADEGVLILNQANSLRDVNEKVYTAWFPQCCPPSLLTRSKSALLDFLHKHHKIVVKPTHKMGGQTIFVLSEGDPNTQVILEEITKKETCFIQAQSYIPEIETIGDKRILLIDGTPIPHGIARKPRPGDHRGNLAVGASAEGFTLTERDLWICEQLKPMLLEKGLFFVGIDVIGNYLTEINVTSPTGIKEINHHFNLDIAATFFDSLNQKLIDHQTSKNHDFST